MRKGGRFSGLEVMSFVFVRCSRLRIYNGKELKEGEIIRSWVFFMLVSYILIYWEVRVCVFVGSGGKVVF